MRNVIYIFCLFLLSESSFGSDNIVTGGTMTFSDSDGYGSWTPSQIVLTENQKIIFLRIWGNHSQDDLVTVSNAVNGATYYVDEDWAENKRTFYGPAELFFTNSFHYINARNIDYAITTTVPVTNTVGYTLSEVADMRVGSQMVNVSNNNARLRFELDMSDDLTASWQTNVHTIEVDMPVTNDVQFFRLRMD